MPAVTRTRLESGQLAALRRVIERAAPVAERREGRHFVPDPAMDAGRVAARAAKWRAAVAGDDAGFAAYLEASGLDGEAFRAGLVDVVLADPDRLPGWARELVAMLESVADGEATAPEPTTIHGAAPQEASNGGAAPQEASNGAAAPRPASNSEAAPQEARNGAAAPRPASNSEATPQEARNGAAAPEIAGDGALGQGAAIAGFLRRAARTVVEHCARIGVELAPSAVDGMLAVLAARLAEVLTAVLRHEARTRALNAAVLGRAGPLPAGPSNVDEWLDLLDRYPVLGYLLGEVSRRWSRYTGEICARLAADRVLLRDALFGGADPGPLTGFEGDAGDRHDEGRAVALLTFAGGYRAVYKPKDLRCAAAFMALVRQLNGLSGTTDLHHRTIVTRPGYAWEQYVAPAGCTATDEIGTFYRRMGMAIRLLQLLEGRDFWLDNLVAHGDTPVFIDLETLLQPRHTLTGLPPSEHAAQQALAESVTETGAVVMMTPIDIGVPAEDLGALATPRRFRSPFRAEPGTGATERYVTWTHPGHAPTVHGLPADAARHLDDLTAGYRQMQHRLVAARDNLLADGGPLRDLRDAPVRFLHRDTWTYYRIARRGVAVPLLADAVDREIFLHRLYRPVFAAPPGGHGPRRHPAVIASEVRALAGLDVPLFASVPDTDAVYAADGTAVPGFFGSTAWERLRHRLERLGSFPLDAHLSLFRSCFSTGHRPPRRTRHTPPPAAECAALPPGRATEEAVQIGRRILDAAVRGDDGLAWLGLARHPDVGLDAVQVLRPDLLSGTCGLAILFADLHAVTGDRAFRDAATGAIAATVRVAQLCRDAGTGQVPYGGFVGLGAHVFALGYCARALREPGLARLATALLRSIDEDATGLLRHPDRSVLSGTCGLLLALTSLPEVDSGDGPAHRLARTLATMGNPEPAVPDPRRSHDPRLADIPGDRAAFRLALARLAASVPTAPVSPGVANHLRPGPESPANDAVDAIGNLLVALELAGAGGESARRAAGRRVARLAARTVDGRGVVNAVEIALAVAGTGDTAGRPDSTAGLVEMAAGVLARALARQRRSGSWFPSSYAFDTHQLSIVDGLPAVARAMLRLDHRHLGSIRLLQPGIDPGRRPHPEPASLLSNSSAFGSGTSPTVPAAASAASALAADPMRRHPRPRVLLGLASQGSDQDGPYPDVPADPVRNRPAGTSG